VQFTGTFGSGGSIQLEGSNDGTTWAILNDLQGTTIVKTAAGLEGVAELTRYVRPRVTAGDGTTALVATLLMRKSA
jgi:urease gamma subunit